MPHNFNIFKYGMTTLGGAERSLQFVLIYESTIVADNTYRVRGRDKDVSDFPE